MLRTKTKRSPLKMSRRAFTLVELLVVIAIIGMLVGLLLPAIQAAREAARRSQCSNNLKQMGLGLLNFYDARKQFPSGYVGAAVYVDGATDTKPGWGWATMILPFIEENSIYLQINRTLPIQDPNNKSAAQLANQAAVQNLIKTYLCPSDLTPNAAFAVPDASGNTVALAAPSSYACTVGSDLSDTTGPVGAGIFYRNSHTKMAEITDGMSKTIMVGERAWSKCEGIWAGALCNAVIQRGPLNPCPLTGAINYPAATLTQSHTHLNNPAQDPDGGLDDYGSLHPTGSNFLFADGSVHFLQETADDNPDGSYSPDSLIFQALGTRAGNETIPASWLEQ